VHTYFPSSSTRRLPEDDVFVVALYVASGCSACWCVRMVSSVYAKCRRRIFFISEFAVLWIREQLQGSRRSFNDFLITKCSPITLLVLHALCRIDQKKTSGASFRSLPLGINNVRLSFSEVRFPVCIHVMFLFFYRFSVFPRNTPPFSTVHSLERIRVIIRPFEHGSPQ
jgi:hypothetical protein